MGQNIIIEDQRIIPVIALLILFSICGLILINQHMSNNFLLPIDPIDPITGQYTYGETYVLPTAEWARNISSNEIVNEDTDQFLLKLYAIFICCILYIINYLINLVF